MPSLTREIPNESPTAQRLIHEIRRRVRFWETGVSNVKEKWREAEERTLAYLPERDVDSVRRAAREGGLPQYTTIQIPYSYAVVMAAHTYLTSVFLGRDPVFQFTGRHGETQQAVQALEALISYQCLVGRFLPYIYTWLYDALKYGTGIIGVWWDERIEMVTTLQQIPELDDLGQPTGKMQKVQSSEPVRNYAGNRIYNIQPQSFIWDVRYSMREFQSGEFAGERRKLGWNEVIRRTKAGYYTNLEFVQEGVGKEIFSGEDDNLSVLERPETWITDMEGPGTSLKPHPMMVEVYQLCWELIPNEWQLSKSDYPEKWMFTVTSDWKVLLGAQPLGARHCKFPYCVLPLEPEGYGLTTRGLPEVLKPVQNTVDWLINSHFYNVRAALNDRWIVDPSKVVMKDVLDPLPGKIVRLKPEAYGTDVKAAVVQFPTSNVTQGQIGTDFPMMMGIGERVGGVNDQIMGMLASGGRKTATEVRTSTSFGVNRLKTTAEFASAAGFDPLSIMLVSNTQQYYDMSLQFRIAGDLLMNSGKSMQMPGPNGMPMPGMPPQPTPGFVLVQPKDIEGFYDFVPVDGTLPIDRFAQVELWKEIFQGILTVPQIGMQYDLGGIFQWVAQLAGLKNITQFKIQVTPDQILAAAAAAGNSVPMNGKGGASKSSNSAGQSSAGSPGSTSRANSPQVPGMT